MNTPVKPQKSGAVLRFLYTTAVGRVLLKILTANAFSAIIGKFMDCPLSKIIINPFVKSKNINLNLYEEKKYTSFNDFFTREIKAEFRPVPQDSNLLISPCDGFLSIYEISENSVLDVKHSAYTVSSLLKSERAAEFFGGYCIVFRLCAENYHRYCFFDNCEIKETKTVKGVLHTVRPTALENRAVFTENCREITYMQTENFGLCAQVEVGAMLVGKIHNRKKSGFCLRGEEKGMFLYGGSTVILLLKKDSVTFCEEYLKAGNNGFEIPVIKGETIGKKGDKQWQQGKNSEHV